MGKYDLHLTHDFTEMKSRKEVAMTKTKIKTAITVIIAVLNLILTLL